MRHRRIVCALILGFSQLAVSYHSGAQEPAFYWRTDLEQVLAESRTNPKLIWLQFTGSWCHFCRRMDAEVFPWAPVASLAKTRFQPVLIHSEHREDLMAHFGVVKLPTTIVLDPTGREFARVQGYRSPEQFLGFLQAAEAQLRPLIPPQPEDVPTEIAMGGSCPVTLIEHGEIVSGQAQIRTSYDGLEYRFQDAAAQARFQADPVKYLPAQRGRCPVTLQDRDDAENGDPRFAVYYRERLYLCKDEASRKSFASDPDRYARGELGGEGYCPHCRASDGRLVRGVPNCSQVHEGVRYEFPDSTHRQAFLDNPNRFVR